MIKPVSVMNSIVKTPAVRNFATATMLTLGVLGVGACAGGSANKTTEQAQTEIVSAEGAEALRNYAKITPKTVYKPIGSSTNTLAIKQPKIGQRNNQ